jgi:hypothetical protein
MSNPIRIVLWFIVLVLIQVNVALSSWDEGFDRGYDKAMGDVVLGFETPTNYFLKKFDIKTPMRVQKKKEHKK